MPQRTLGLSSLIMITIVSVATIRNLPAMALFGSQLIFFLGAAVILFFIPCALASAELASRFPKQSGLYVWVKAAFGPQLASLAVWVWWMSCIIWHPILLSFVAGTLAYLFYPELAQHKLFLIAVVVTLFWLATITNLLGISFTARITTVCTYLGLIIPALIIVAFGAAWLLKGQNVHIIFASESILIPLHHPNTWVALTGIMMSLCGIEIATVHAAQTKDPQRNIPKALLYATLLIVGLYLLGSLAIAIVLPSDSISLIVGIMQALTVFFEQYQMPWLVSLIGGMIILGSLGSLTNWIIAPIKVVHMMAHEHNLPKLLQRVNRYQVPSGLLICQGIIVTVLSFALLLIPTINGSYWMLTASAALLYMVTYLFILAACLALRLKSTAEPTNTPDPVFKIPGGKLGMLIIISLGMITCVTTMVVSFTVPEQIEVGSIQRYQLLLTLTMVVMILPAVLYSITKRKLLFSDKLA